MELIVYKSSDKIFNLEIPEDELLEGTEIYIGRSNDCHIVIDDQLVSRHHAVIIVEKDHLILKKITQFGDIFVNGILVDNRFKLNESDKITMTNYLIEVVRISNTVKMIEKKAEEIVVDENLTEILYDSVENQTTSDKNIDEILKSESDVIDDEFQDENDSSSFDSAEEFEEKTLSDSTHEDDNSIFAEGTNEGENFDENGFPNDGFGDDGFGDDGFGDQSIEEKTQVFQTFASYSLKIFGEHAPFDEYKLDDREIFIGRDPEKCQIILNDPEVSSVHAKIHKSMINCVLEDMNSSNGTILNGSRINKSELVNGDEFVIGETSFTVVINSDLIEAEKDTLMPVSDNQEVEIIEEVEEEVNFDELSEEDEYSLPQEESKSIIKKIMNDPKKKRIAIYGSVAFILFLLLTPDEETTTKNIKETKPKVQNNKDIDKTKNNEKVTKKKLSPEVIEKLEQLYALGLAKFEAGDYQNAKYSLDQIKAIDPNYKNTQTLLKLVNQGYEEKERLIKEEQAEKERQERNLKIKQIVEKARDAVEKREVQISRNYFAQILELDPENIDVPQMKMIIDAYVKEKEDKRLAEEKEKALRQKMVESLKPSKTLYLKEDWYNAIGELEKFIKLQGIDEDLIEEATEMLKTSRRKLSAVVNPMLGKARSFKEGQDLKKAFELFGEILKYDPSNEEALIERQDIKELLDIRSRKVYREALISESLSLFDEAKEKFQEVQQISPMGSEYYLKASKKLKNYLE